MLPKTPTNLPLTTPCTTIIGKQGHADLHLKTIANGCAKLAAAQLTELAKINQHRQTLSTLYHQAAQQHGWHVPVAAHADATLQKYPVLWPDADTVRARLKAAHIYLDDGWCGAVICPRSVDPVAVGYAKGSCPQAEKVAREILCLPTHPTMSMKRAEHLVSTLATGITQPSTS